MNRLIVICEGPTEQEFCNDVLQEHFNSKSISVESPTIKKSKGGIVHWSSLKKQIENHLKSDSATVTLLIDYYGIKEEHGFPKWKEALRITDKNERISFLESAMKDDLHDDISYRFIPNIQLHEFESLLFCDKQVFDDNFDDGEFINYKYLEETMQIENPEMINDGVDTCPSARLGRILESYKKPTMGSLLAQEIGLEKIREKCPRFNAWIDKCESLSDN